MFTPSSRSSAGRWTLVGLLLVVIYFAFAAVRTQVANVSHGSVAPGASIAGIGPAPRAWRHLARRSLVSQTIDVQKVQGWTVPPNALNGNPNLRCTLSGQFATSEPLQFVVIDATNWARLQAGDPPIIAYAAPQSIAISTPCPAPGSFVGFVRPDPQFGGMPLTTAQLALQLVARYEAAHRPPARVTAELWQDGECFCTEAEAQAGRVRVN